MSYLLDANVFISAKNLHYGLDFCPAFWEWLTHGGNTGTVFSIDKVADEIEAGGDDLSAWPMIAPALFVWWLRPVRMATRVGEHRAVVWKRLYLMP